MFIKSLCSTLYSKYWDKTRLKRSDLCKIDFGVQINGNIIDCAFSFSFDERHDTLMKAVKSATYRGIEVMGIDARLGEIGGEIQKLWNHLNVNMIIKLIQSNVFEI